MKKSPSCSCSTKLGSLPKLATNSRNMKTLKNSKPRTIRLKKKILNNPPKVNVYIQKFAIMVVHRRPRRFPLIP
jgi:hypothetical protein